MQDAEWPPFGKELITRLNTCSLFAILVLSRFGFQGGIWAQIAPVPGQSILVTFIPFCHMLLCI